MNYIDQSIRVKCDKENALLSVRNASYLLDLKKTTIYKLLADGTLRSVKLGGRRLIDPESVREVRARCRVGIAGGES